MEWKQGHTSESRFGTPAIAGVSFCLRPDGQDPLARRHTIAVAPLSAGLTSNSRYRIKDAGPRNREENDVLPERCGPFHNADEEFCN